MVSQISRSDVSPQRDGENEGGERESEREKGERSRGRECAKERGERDKQSERGRESKRRGNTRSYWHVDDIGLELRRSDGMTGM